MQIRNFFYGIMSSRRHANAIFTIDVDKAIVEGVDNVSRDVFPT